MFRPTLRRILRPDYLRCNHLAGIDTAASGVGFHHLTIRLRVDTALPRVHTEFNSVYGKVASSWDRTDGRFRVTLPANTSATVILPDAQTEEIGRGARSFAIR